MLYICIPAHNEADTVGVLLWRIRKVFQGFSREYEILVYDDASTDGTGELLVPYGEVAPLTVIRGETRVGYGRSLEALVREASRRTKYPRRDAVIVMQGDFTDQPETIPDLVKPFEGGADVILTQRGSRSEPATVRKLRQLAPWALRFFMSIKGVADPYAAFRLYRISLLRDLIKSAGDEPLITADGWAANVELLMKAMPLARRVESISSEPRYDLRVRESRIRPFSDAINLFRFGRTARGRSITLPVPATVQPGTGSAPRQGAREKVTS